MVKRSLRSKRNLGVLWKNGQYPSEPIRFEKGDEKQTASVEAQKFGALAVSFNQGLEKNKKA